MNKVMIIDDEPWSREVVKALGEWEKLNLIVSGEAEDGIAALKLISELKPQIVITDMRMPGIDGVGLLKELKQQFPRLKIIVMSGYDDFDYLKEAIRSRAVEYLLKPIEPNELNEALQKCILELEVQKQTVNTSWRSPLVFPSAHLMDRYGVLRQRVFAALFELSQPLLLQSMNKLEEFLGQTFPLGTEASMLIKIRDDFSLILEDFMSENQVGFEANNLKSQASWSYENVKDMLNSVLHSYEEAIDKIESVSRTKSRLVILEVQHYIDQHYMEPISLETVAHHFYVSKEHLSRAYKTIVGENMTEYIIRKRMERAKQLLVHTAISIKKVAQICGYSEIAYFHRVFKKYFGITPGEIRSGKG
ncbi:response regulator transcription factor [Paenibacillus sp. LPE1-1-1.1]|uniref:response regulator transcription factor n=1 Tax=Paenibacillus sp. LPE1-1-1.1 TaxID=3135230 RepID=UPI003429EEEE